MEEPSGWAARQHHSAVRGMLRRLEVEAAELQGRDDICMSEELELLFVSEHRGRGLTIAEDMRVRLQLCRELEVAVRDDVEKAECLGWEKLASRFLQIGIPRKNVALAGAVVRASPSVDARKTLRQMREGTVVVVEEVAGNWARVSSPVKGWVWRTHLKPISDAADGDNSDSPNSFNELTPGMSSESFPPIIECASQAPPPGLPRPTRYSSDYAPYDYTRPPRYSQDQESRTARYSCDYDYASQDDDSLFGLRPTIVHGSIGSTSRNQNLSDTDLAASLTRKQQDPSNFKPGDRVKMRDAASAPWAWGHVKRVASGRVYIQRDGYPGMACWRYFVRDTTTAGPLKKTKNLEVLRAANEPLGVDLHQENLTVQSIDEASPARAAGLRVGMKVVKLDQMSVSSMLDIRTLLRTAGERLTIGVLEDDDLARNEHVRRDASSDGRDRDLDEVTSVTSTTMSNTLSSPKLSHSASAYPPRGDGYGYIPRPAALALHRTALLALHRYVAVSLPSRLNIHISPDTLRLIVQFVRPPPAALAPAAAKHLQQQQLLLQYAMQHGQAQAAANAGSTSSQHRLSSTSPLSSG